LRQQDHERSNRSIDNLLCSEISWIPAQNPRRSDLRECTTFGPVLRYLSWAWSSSCYPWWHLLLHWPALGLWFTKKNVFQP